MELERAFLQAGCPSLSAHRHTEVKTVYSPDSLHSLGGYKNTSRTTKKHSDMCKKLKTTVKQLCPDMSTGTRKS